jgi:hypothetical protein
VECIQSVLHPAEAHRGVASGHPPRWPTRGPVACDRRARSFLPQGGTRRGSAGKRFGLVSLRQVRFPIPVRQCSFLRYHFSRVCPRLPGCPRSLGVKRSIQEYASVQWACREPNRRPACGKGKTDLTTSIGLEVIAFPEPCR